MSWAASWRRATSPPPTSHLDENIRRAGLVTCIRTSTPEMAFSTTTEAVLYGCHAQPLEPGFQRRWISGGAGAVAAVMVPIAPATDAAGSIRVPASSNGVFGLKPTRGRVPPWLGDGWSSTALASSWGSAARCVTAPRCWMRCSVLTLASRITQRRRHSWLSQVTRQPGRLRIGMMTEAWNGGKTESNIAGATAETAVLLAALGHRVSETEMAIGVSWQSWCSPMRKSGAPIWSAGSMV